MTTKGKLSFRRSDTPAQADAGMGAGAARPWKILLLFLTGLFAATLTAAGFFSDSVPFWLAYTPFLIALIIRSRGHRAALVGGHFAIVFEIAATGLLQLGFSAWIVGIGFLLAVLTLSAGFAVFGVGLAAVLLLLIPYFPGNPLLITGALYPGVGLFGIALLAGASMAIPIWRRSWARLLAVLLTIVAPSLTIHSIVDDGLLNIPQLGNREQTAPTAASGSDAGDTDSPFESIALSRSSGTDLAARVRVTWRILLALRDIPAGSQVFTGENVLTAEDGVGQRRLCRAARAQALDLYIGVQGADGAGEIWRYSGETCPTGTRVYRAVIGIPGLTGSFWPDVTDTGAPVNLPPALDGIGFLACFEAFALHRWIFMGVSDFETVIAVSNDHWTDPLPVALLRAKVSDQFARLFGIEVVHAGRDQNILVLKGESAIAEEKRDEG